CIPERDAAIALGMLVSALEALALVAEQQRTGRHQSAAERRSVVKAAGHDNREVEPRVAFLERTILRTGRAHDVGDRPTLAAGDEAWAGASGCPVRPAFCQRALQFDRNFRQDRVSARVL